jgi:hypothetical protein
VLSLPETYQLLPVYYLKGLLQFEFTSINLKSGTVASAVYNSLREGM